MNNQNNSYNSYNLEAETVFSQEHLRELFTESHFSPTTIKNYLADISHLSSWFEKEFQKPLTLPALTPEIIELFKKGLLEKQYSTRTINRHFSSLRALFKLLKKKGFTFKDPTRKIDDEGIKKDFWHIKQFKDYLYVFGSADLTIKNYILDAQHFLDWAEKNVFVSDFDVSGEHRFSKLSNSFPEYHKKLIEIGFSPASIKRKTSSIKKYFGWAAKEGYLKKPETPIVPLVSQTPTGPFGEPLKPPHANIFLHFLTSPLRLFKRLTNFADFIFESWVVTPFVILIEKVERRFGKKETTFYAQPPPFPSFNFRSRRLYFIPGFLLLIGLLGFFGYQLISKRTGPVSFTVQAPTNQPLTAGKTRTFAFAGKLTDSANVPITKSVSVNFVLYPGQTDSKALWKETTGIIPDKEGQFSILLGEKTPLPGSLFMENETLFLGIKIEGKEELKPRQQIPNVDLSRNAQYLQGKTASSQPAANMVPILDSEGNLNLAAASPSIVSTSGDFSLVGESLILKTIKDGNITLSPDGRGGIDIQKALFNSTNSGTVPGAVEITDVLNIISTSSGQPAVTISQNGTGDLFSVNIASQSAFLIKNTGYVGIGTANPTKMLEVAGDIKIGSNLAFSGTSLNFLNNSATESARLTSTGNFGLGTAAPQGRLHVTGGIKGKALVIFDETGDQNILTASASGTTKLTLSRTGNLGLTGEIFNTTGDTFSVNDSLKVLGTTLSVGNGSAATIKTENAALTIDSGTGNSITLGSSDVLNMSGNFAQTGAVTFSTGTGAVSLNGAVTAGSTLAVTGAATLSSTLAVTGDTTLTGDLAVNGADITTTSTGTAAIFNTNATTLNIGGASTTLSIGAATGTTTVNNALTVTGAATFSSTLNSNTFTSTALTFAGANPAISASTAGTNLTIDAGTSGQIQVGGTSTGDILLGGGSSSTGCTITNSNGNLTCAGNITGGSTGTVGYWTRSGTTLSPATSGDAITTSGTISTSGGLSLTTGALSLTGTSGSIGLTGFGTTSITSTTTSGDINSLSDTSFALGAGSTGNLLNLAFTAGSTNTNGTAITTGLNIAPTQASTGVGGTHETYGITVQAPVISGTPTGTNNSYGVKIGSQGGTGITNGYALYLDSQTGATTNYAIYSAGGQSVHGGNLRIGGTTAPTVALDVTGAALISSTLGVTGDTTLTGDLAVNGADITTTATGTATVFNTNATTLNIGGAATTISLGNSAGTVTINGNLTVSGVTTSNGSVTLGSSTSNTIAFTGVVASNIVPSSTNDYNLGSSSKVWATGYFTNVNATNITGTIVGGNTNAATWLVNADNATNNAEIAGVAFAVGTAPINDVLQWNAANDTTNKISGFDNTNLFNYPIGIFSQVSGANQTFTSGSILLYSQPATHAITQSGAFIGANMDFSSNITVPNTASGNQTGFKTTLKDGGASATSIGFQTAGTLDYGLDIGGTVGTADIRLSNAETIDNLTDNQVNIGFGATGGILKLTNGSSVVSDQTSVSLFNTTTTTLNIGGAATTALNIGNGNTAYTAINIGSGTGGNTINIAGTGATGADIINIGTGGTSADTVTIGNNASTTSLALTSGTGSQTFTSSVISGTTTTSAFVMNASALTTGTALYLTSTATSGKLLDLNATETSGTIVNLAYGTAKSLGGALTGQAIDLSTNVTNVAQSVTGESIALPVVTAANTTTVKGLSLSTGAFTTAAAAASSTWTGLDITMPAITQGAGSTLTSTGLKITGGTVTSGTSYGLIVDTNAGSVGIGTTGPDSPLDILSTGGSQLRLTYTDGSVYTTFNTDSSGNLTIDGTGTKQIMADDLQVTGNDILSSTATALTLAGADVTVADDLKVTGTLGIGVTPSPATYALYLEKTMTDPGGFIGAYTHITATPSDAMSGNFYGNWVRMQTAINSATTNVVNMRGLYVDWVNSVAGGATVTSQTGAYFDTISQVTGVNQQLYLGSVTGGTTGNYGLYSINSATGVTVPAYNIYLTDQQTVNTTSGALTNYAAYITNTGSRSAGANALTNVGLYVTASGAQNNYAAIFEAGSVGIGTTGPDSPLDILSTGGTQLRLTYTDGSVSTTFNTDSSGNLTIDGTGTKTIIADDLQVTGNDILSSTATALTLAGADVTVADDLTVTGREAIGTTLDTSVALNIIKAEANPAATKYGIYTALSTTETVASNANQVMGVAGLVDVYPGNTQAWTNTYGVVGVYGRSKLWQPTAGSYTVTGAAQFVASANVGGANVTLTNRYGMYVENPSNSGTLNNNYGLYVTDQTGGTTDYGLAIEGADTAALWLSSAADNTDAANGIAFGLSRDTNLYRSAANTLKTDDGFIAAGGINSTAIGAGTASTGAFTTLSATPGSDVTALTLTGTSVSSANLAYLNSKNTSGTILNLAYGAGATLGGALTGQAIDLSTNVTNVAQSVTGESITLPIVSAANTTTVKGLTLSTGAFTTAAAAASSTWTGLDITMPAITQGAGSTLTSTGLKITGGTVTSGTSYGLIVDTNAGNVGIGDTSPAATLTVGDGDLFQVAGATGSVTINNASDTGSLSVEGTVLDINSLDFVGAGTLTSGAAQNLTFTPGTTGDLVFSTDADTTATFNGSAEGTPNVTLTAGDLTLTDGDLIVTAGDFSFTGATGVINLSSTLDIDSAGATIDATTLSIDSTDTANFTMTANAAGDKTLTVSATNAGVGTGLISMSADGNINIDTSAGILYLNNTNNQVVNTGTGDFVADSTGTFSAISAATINLGTANIGSTIQIGTEGTTADTITIGNTNAATTLALTGGDDWNITGAGAANFVSIGGATAGTGTFTTLTVNTGLVPDADDGAYLGQSGTAFSDLFLASGAVINFAAGDVTLTHAANILAIEGGSVGIGTTGPDSPLDVLSTGGSQLRLTYTDGTVYTTFNTDTSGNLTIDATGTKTVVADDLQVTGNDILSSTATALTLAGADVTVADDLTVTGREAIGTTLDTSVALNIIKAEANPAATKYGIYTALSTTETVASNANQVMGLAGLVDVYPGNTQAWTNTYGVVGVYGRSKLWQPTAGSYTVTGAAQFVASANVGGANVTLTNRYGMYVENPSNSGTLNNNYGLYVTDQTGGTTDYGLAIEGADTAALWLSSAADNTDAANGIAFGSSKDTNLYRSAANTLKTDDSLTVGVDLIVSGGDVTGTGDEGIDIGEATANAITFLIDATGEAVLTSSALSPVTSDGSALGTSSLMWGDLFLASGGVINFNNGDVTITHAANVLAIEGGNVGIGTTGPDSPLDVLSTGGSQLRLTYTDGTVYTTFNTDSSGNLTIDGTGTKTIIADDLQVTGNDILSSTATALTLSGADVSVAGDLTVGNNALKTTSGVAAVPATSTPWQVFKNTSFTNILPNANFESWTAGTSVAPDGWTDGGGTGTISREGTIIKLGTYSAKVDSASGADGSKRLRYSGISVADYKGKTITFGAWVYATVASNARIEIYDDTYGFTSSAWHTGDSTWQFLTVTRAVSASATLILFDLYVKNPSTAATTGYFDGAVASEGPVVYAFAPKPLNDTDSQTVYGATNFLGNNVGIGDATPDYTLELYDATNTPAFALSDDDIGHGVTTLAQTDVFFHLSSISTTDGGAQLTGLADATGIALGLKGVQSSDPTDTTPAVSIIGAKASGTGVVDLGAAETVFQVANNDDAAALTILGDGKVGIGTAGPDSTLHVIGGTCIEAADSGCAATSGTLSIPIATGTAPLTINSTTKVTNLNADLLDGLDAKYVGGGFGIYGEGSDGNTTISGNTTLTRDMYYNNLTVNNGITLTTAGFRVFVKNTLTNNGTISNSGGNASSTTKGTGSVAGSLGAGGDGSDGSCGGAPSAGTNEIYSLGGAGGAGNPGGAGGTVTAPGTQYGGFKSSAMAIQLWALTWSANTAINGGGGGGGGSYNGECGGGGGGGGGVIMIAAKTLTNSSGTIKANGGNGVNGPGGAGGGGGGGVVVLVYNVLTAGTEQASGGTGTGATNGSDGTVLKIDNTDPIEENLVWRDVSGYDGGAPATTPPPAPADVAEYYEVTDQTIEPGDVVSVASGSNQDTYLVEKSAQANNFKTLGIISTKPRMILNEGDASLPGKILRPVALAGRVPVKVSTENGPIAVGDALTSSSTPGVAMKATRPGAIVGKALESFDPEHHLPGEVAPAAHLEGETYTGKILAFVNVSWYDPDVYLASTGELVIAKVDGGGLTMEGGSLTLENGSLNPSSNLQPQNSTLYSLSSTVNGIISRVGAFSEAVIANLQVGSLTANKIVSPLAEIDTLRTNIISPLAQDSSISLSLKPDKIEILNNQTATPSAVASFDNQGNATFSGQLNSNSLTSNEATIAGTLRAGKIVADDIEGLNAKIATLSANTITNITNVYEATPSAGGANGTQGTNETNASGSSVSSDSYPTFPNGLVALGPTSLADLSVAGNFYLGANFIISQNSIEVLGSDLSLQGLRQGGIALAGGRVYIDRDGNLKVEGDVSIGGTLAANIISPLPDQDLVIHLGGVHSATSEVTGTGSSDGEKLVVQNASGSAVLSVNQTGDLTASGSATFKKLNLFSSPVFALSDTEVIASGSAGTTILKGQKTELTIKNPLVTEKSLIYITPTANTNNQVLYLLRQEPGISFTVGVEQPPVGDIPFNWLIVN